MDSRGVAYPLYYALHALQHRGQEAAGITTFDGTFHYHKGQGELSAVFDESVLKDLPGTVGIGQVLYSEKAVRNHPESIQPLNFEFLGHHLSISVDASLLNAEELRREAEGRGNIFATLSNAELIAVMIAQEFAAGHDSVLALTHALLRLKGAYSGAALLDGTLYAFRDPLGVKPLCYGKSGHGWIVVSESVGLDILSAKLEGDVESGEILEVTAEGVTHHRFAKADHTAHCIFEYVYTARPDSVIDGILVYDARRRIGAYLGRTGAKADLVSPVPDSGTAFAAGYAETAHVPYIEGLLKNRYVGRTFIMPAQSLRENAVRMKLNPVRGHVADKSVVLVDDSIVRGTTSLRIVDMVKDFGAREVHMEIGSTPIIAPCYFGVDLPTREELIATGRSVEEIREKIHATTLHYISTEDLVKSVGIPAEDLCMACASGDYPLAVPCEKCSCARRITPVK